MIYQQQYHNQYDLFLTAFKPSKEVMWKRKKDEKNRTKNRQKILKFQFRVYDWCKIALHID